MAKILEEKYLAQSVNIYLVGSLEQAPYMGPHPEV